MGIHWPDVIRNEELWKRAEEERIDTQIRRRKWGLYRAHAQKTNKQYHQACTEMEPTG